MVKPAVAYRATCVSVVEERFKSRTFTRFIKRMGMRVLEANQRDGVTARSVCHESDWFGYCGQYCDFAGDSGDGPNAMVILLPICGWTPSLHPVSALSEPPPDSITTLWLASFPAPVKPARDCLILIPSAHPAVSQHQEPVSWHQTRYDDE